MSDDIHKYPSQTADRFQVRLPDGMREQIARAAKANGRSMNAEILDRLHSPYVNLSEDGLIALARRLQATTLALEDLFFGMRDLDLTPFLTEQAKAGNPMTREQALRHILRDWLIGHGYLEMPPDRDDAN